MHTLLSILHSRALAGCLVLACVLASATTSNAQGQRQPASTEIELSPSDAEKLASKIRSELDAQPHDDVLRESLQKLVTEGWLTRREAGQFYRLSGAETPEATRDGIASLMQSDNAVLTRMASVLEGLVESYPDEGGTDPTWPEAVTTVSASAAVTGGMAEWLCRIYECESVTADVVGAAAEIGGAVGLDLLSARRE